MANNVVNFTVNLDGTAYKGIVQLSESFDKLNATASKTETLLGKFNALSFGIDNLLSASQRVADAIGKIVDVGSSDELQKMNMTTLFKGNADAANDMFNRISKYGKETVYDKAGLIDAQKTMMSFGIEGEKAFSTLQQIGDIAMGDSEKMKSLALAFSQATSAGKLQGQDFLQLINAGFNPLQTISERTGESMLSLKEKMSKGQISAEMLSQAFRWATDEQGLFYNGAEVAGKTTMGLINQLKDTVDEFLINVFYGLKPLIDESLLFATSFLESLPNRFSNIGNSIKNLIDRCLELLPIILGVGGAVAALTIACNAGKISLMLQNLWLDILIVKEQAVTIATKLWAGAQAILNAVMNANVVAKIIAGISILVGIITYLCSKITGWGSLWQGIVGFMKYSFFAFVDAIRLYFNTYINGFLIGLDKIKLGWYKFKEAAGIGDSSENQAAINKINADVEARQKAIAEGAQKVKDNVLKAQQSLQGIEMGWKSDEKKEDKKTSNAGLGTNNALASAVSQASGNRTSAATGSAMSTASNNVTTGGTRSTNIQISIKNMVESITFQGSTSENRSEIERNLAEAMFRVLNMAQSSVG